MNRLYNNIISTIGNTPMIKLNNYSFKNELKTPIIAKVEYLNPFGSIKDRVAAEMLKMAEVNKLIDKETLIIEPTSGNTGIGLAAYCAAKGYKLILTMPDTMSIERRKLLLAYGAKVVLTPGSFGMMGAIEEAKRIKGQNKNSFMPSQFENSDNPNVHYKTTGIEIYNTLNGKIDYFVACIGTGGTISGVGKRLKEMNTNIKIIGIEPEGSPVITKGYSGPHKIQGIGAGFIPENLNLDIIDEMLVVNDEEAFKKMKELSRSEGIFAGISSGAALAGATVVAKKNPGKTVVVLFPDGGERYLSLIANGEDDE